MDLLPVLTTELHFDHNKRSAIEILAIVTKDLKYSNELREADSFSSIAELLNDKDTDIRHLAGSVLVNCTGDSSAEMLRAYEETTIMETIDETVLKQDPITVAILLQLLQYLSQSRKFTHVGTLLTFSARQVSH